jgi:hypothetical protein
VSDSTNQAINTLFMRVTRRAENATAEYLARTFVPIEPLPSLLNSLDNQVIYGRRGTGKTHLLKYLAETKRREGDFALYLDLRTLGSSGLYGDRSQSLELRATQLLVDLVEAIHAQLYDLLDGHFFDDILDTLIPCLDAVGEAATQVRVVGTTERTLTIDAVAEHNQRSGANIGLRNLQPTVSVNVTKGTKRRTRASGSRKQSGTEVPLVQFGPLGRALTSLVEAMAGRKVWIFVDEWSNGVPRDLQPLLADLLRRCFFPVRNLTVKIAALERQSYFRKTISSADDYIGIDLGADTGASIDLDDYLVFRTNRAHALSFFSELLYRHVSVLMDEHGYQFAVSSADALRALAFAGPAFVELVKAAEGVPRDALNVSGLAAAAASKEAISYRSVHAAARSYYLRDKEGRISQAAETLLDEIVRDCVREGTRELALKRRGESDSLLIQELYDNRLIHRVEQGVLIDENSSTRFDIYLVDFGCFVDLLARGGGHTVSDGTDVLRVVNTRRVRLNSGSVARAQPARIKKRSGSPRAAD